MAGTTRDSSGDSRSDTSEPWDERPEDAGDAATKKSVPPSAGASTNSKTNEHDMVRTDLYIDKTEPLEDGDLPPLSLSRSVSINDMRGDMRGGTFHSGNSHKPSEEELNKQRKFWSQLDDSPSLHTSESETQRKQREQRAEGPDDEMNADNAETRDAPRPSKKNGRDGDIVEQMRATDSEDSDDSKDSKEFVVDEQEETNFCDHTLSAMETICGQDFCGGNASGKTIKNPNIDNGGQLSRQRSGRKLKLNARDEGSVEEHTAIEVEYIEPELSGALNQERPENWSPSRKNAYLAAMARKAKEDYERSSAQEMASMSPKRKSTIDESEAAEDVYSTFTASEKRKFLRLINSGLSSTESAERVRAERKDKSKDEKKESKKGKLFKFWKKGSSKSKESKGSKMPVSPKKQTVVNSNESSMEAAPTEGEEKKEDDVRTQGQSTATSEGAVAVSEGSVLGGASGDATATQSTSEEAQEDSLAPETTADPDTESKAASQSQIDRFRQSLQQHQETQSVVAALSIDTSSQSVPKSSSLGLQNHSYVSSDAPASQKSSANNMNSPSSVSSADPFDFREEGDDVDFDERFAKSGINYYDAVRRDFSENEEDSDNPTSPSGKKNPRSPHLGPLIQSPKLKGFSKLSKREKNAPGERESASTTVALASTFREQTTVVVTPDAPKQKLEEKAEFPAVQNFGGSGSVASATPSATGKELEAFSKVEQELLRPVRKNITANVVSPELKPSEATQQMKSQTTSETEKDVDFNMQEYFNSTEAYPVSGVGNDNMSVVSGKSFSTAETSLHGPASVYTQSSTLTQSSRKRRPGAAKTRLAKAKEAEKHAATKQGWHESIRAAAQTANRVWKPNVGWVDYEEPQDVVDMSTDTSVTGKMHLNLRNARPAKHDENSAVTGGNTAEKAPTSGTDFGDKEQDRPVVVRNIVNTHPSLSPKSFQNPASVPARKFSKETADPLELDGMSVEQSVAHSVDQFMQSVKEVTTAGPSRRRDAPSPSRAKRMATSPSKRIGWIDSMKAASANVVKDGQSWDPMSGWANVDQAEPREQSVGNNPSADEERQAEYVTEEPGPNDTETTSLSNREPSSEERTPEGPQNVVVKLSSREGHQKKDSAVLDKWVGKDTKGIKSHPVMQHETTDLIDSDTELPQDDSDDVPLLNTSGDSAEDGFDTKATVNVVREKVDDDDLNWFPKQQPRRGSANTHVASSTKVSTITDEHNKEPQNTSLQKSVSSSTSSRRGAGPVDVDEAENYSDDDEKGVVWDGVVFENDSFVEADLASTPSPRQQVSGAPKSGSSVTSLSSSFSKSVPKLTHSKRDTSPIRGRKNTESSRSAWRDNASTSVSDTTFPAFQDIDKPREDTQNKSRAIDQEYSTKQYIDQRSGRDDSSAPSSTSSSIVKVRAQQWESKSKMPKDRPTFTSGHDPPRDNGRLNSATAEWKSFLGKKVQAENEAAAREKERIKQDNDMGEPRVLYADEHQDSLFDFSNDRTFPTSPSAISSPPRKRNHTDGSEQGYGKKMDDSTPQAAPPSEGSDFSDGNEINKGFFTRLAGCAAPMLPKRGENGELPHLAFLRTEGKGGNSASSKFMPQYLCGRPNVIHEESDEDGDDPTVATKDNQSAQSEPKVSQYKDIHTKSREVKGDTRSVISEDFGAKTAYLEALAMKTAVSKPKRSSSRPRGDRSSAGASETSVSTSKSHKEKWKEFLERKSAAAAGASPVKSKPSGSETSAAAETYAAKKVEEMMAIMASRSKSTPRSWRSPDEKRAQNDRYRASQRRTPYELSRQRSDPANKDQQQQKKTDSMYAAEALAAARVNAMMEALANSNNHSKMDEGEI